MKNSRIKLLVLLFAGAALLSLIAYQFRDVLRPQFGYRRAVASLFVDVSPWQTPERDDRDAEIEFVADFYGHRYSGNSGNLIDRAILDYGAFEKPLLYLFRDIAKRLESMSVFVDIGANTGQHSIFMSSHVHEVHAFEPCPPVLARFRQMIEDNRITNVHIHPFGLGAKRETLTFFEPPSYNLGTGSFLGDFENNDSPETTLLLEVRRGDIVFPERGISRVDLVKIDVEGYEKAVLQGLKGTLRERRPILEMELSVFPGRESAFRDESELRSALPERYRLLMMDEGWSHLGMGYYSLKKFDVDFSQAVQHSVIAYPKESAALIPTETWP